MIFTSDWLLPIYFKKRKPACSEKSHGLLACHLERVGGVHNTALVSCWTTFRFLPRSADPSAYWPQATMASARSCLLITRSWSAQPSQQLHKLHQQEPEESYMTTAYTQLLLHTRAVHNVQVLPVGKQPPLPLSQTGSQTLEECTERGDLGQKMQLPSESGPSPKANLPVSTK